MNCSKTFQCIKEEKEEKMKTENQSFTNKHFVFLLFLAESITT